LLFVEGAYETVTVGDRDSGQLHDVTVEVASGNAADPGDLRRLDREPASRRAPALSPELRDLLLRHPKLAQVRAWVTRDRQAERQLVTGSTRDAARLAEEASVVRIDPAEEPIALIAVYVIYRRLEQAYGGGG
jgi:hypothetical protein